MKGFRIREAKKFLQQKFSNHGGKNTSNDQFVNRAEHVATFPERYSKAETTFAHAVPSPEIISEVYVKKKRITLAARVSSRKEF